MNELNEENKYLFYDLNLLHNLNVCAYFQMERTQILQKRCGQQHDQEASLLSTIFEIYFNNFGGSKSNLPEYLVFIVYDFNFMLS